MLASSAPARLGQVEDNGRALEPERLILFGASPTRSRAVEREAIDSLGIRAIAEADAAAEPRGFAPKGPIRPNQSEQWKFTDMPCQAPGSKGADHDTRS